MPKFKRKPSRALKHRLVVCVLFYTYTDTILRYVTTSISVCFLGKTPTCIPFRLRKSASWNCRLQNLEWHMQNKLKGNGLFLVLKRKTAKNVFFCHILLQVANKLITLKLPETANIYITCSIFSFCLLSQTT